MTLHPGASAPAYPEDDMRGLNHQLWSGHAPGSSRCPKCTPPASTPPTEDETTAADAVAQAAVDLLNDNQKENTQ